MYAFCIEAHFSMQAKTTNFKSKNSHNILNKPNGIKIKTDHVTFSVCLRNVLTMLFLTHIQSNTRSLVHTPRIRDAYRSGQITNAN